MSTTKPDADTGWTDNYPHKSSAGDEYHFVRRKDGRDVVIMGFSMGKAWLNGVSYEPAELRSHLFLGPLSPSDFEQLLRLRKATGRALETLIAQRNKLCLYCKRDEHRFDRAQKMHVFTRPGDNFDGQLLECKASHLLETIAALREALAHTGESL